MATKKKQKKQQLKTQAIGLLILAFGLLLSLSVFFDAAGVMGLGISAVLTGVFGIGAFVLPIVVCALGIFIVSSSDKSFGHMKLIMVFFLFIFALCILHLAQVKPLAGEEYFNYVQNAFKVGFQEQQGGGIFAAMLVFPINLLVGEIGSYVLYSIAILILVTLLFSLSLREISKQASEKIKNMKTTKEEPADQTVAFSEPKSKRIVEPRPKPKPKQKRGFAKKNGDVIAESNQVYDEYPNTRKKQNLFIDTLEVDEQESKGEEQKVYQPMVQRQKNITVKEMEDSYHPSDENGDMNGQMEEGLAKDNIVQYEKPPISLLSRPVKSGSNSSRDLVQENADKLEKTLNSFGVSARVTQVVCGPTVTQYEVLPAPGVRVSRIAGLSDNIALDLAASSVRIEAPIPGKSAIGIEVPNTNILKVFLRESIESKEFKTNQSDVCFALGKSIGGKNIVVDLAKMPHILIAGTTGSGKSVCINNIIISLLYKSSPKQVRMIMIDPKMVELSIYNDVPHLLVPVVTDAKKAAEALNWATREMDERYMKFANTQTRDLEGYNKAAIARGEEAMPSLVVIIDELADLMMVAPRDVEDAICRLAQKGRASGIHLVIATQRPSVNVITGVIKANIPSRIAFSVSSQVDSRTILDMGGAEKLLGRGDMLYYPVGQAKPVRIQGAFVSDDEVNNITTYMRSRYRIQYDENVETQLQSVDSNNTTIDGRKLDEKTVEALKIALDNDQVSISMLQRKMQIGYSRAGRIIDELEQMGCISGFSGSKSRDVLITREEFEERFFE